MNSHQNNTNNNLNNNCNPGNDNNHNDEDIINMVSYNPDSFEFDSLDEIPDDTFLLFPEEREGDELFAGKEPVLKKSGSSLELPHLSKKPSSAELSHLPELSDFTKDTVNPGLQRRNLPARHSVKGKTFIRNKNRGSINKSSQEKNSFHSKRDDYLQKVVLSQENLQTNNSCRDDSPSPVYDFSQVFELLGITPSPPFPPVYEGSQFVFIDASPEKPVEVSGFRRMGCVKPVSSKSDPFDGYGSVVCNKPVVLSKYRFNSLQIKHPKVDSPLLSIAHGFNFKYRSFLSTVVTDKKNYKPNGEIRAAVFAPSFPDVQAGLVIRKKEPGLQVVCEVKFFLDEKGTGFRSFTGLPPGEYDLAFKVHYSQFSVIEYSKTGFTVTEDYISQGNAEPEPGEKEITLGILGKAYKGFLQPGRYTESLGYFNARPFSSVDFPLELKEIFAHKAVLRALSPLKKVQLALINPVNEKYRVHEFDNVSKGSELEIEIDYPYTVIHAAAWGEVPMESWGVVFRKSKIGLKLETPDTVKPGEEIKIRLKSAKPVKCLLVVSEDGAEIDDPIKKIGRQIYETISKYKNLNTGMLKEIDGTLILDRMNFKILMERFKCPNDITSLVPELIAKRYNVLPLGKLGDKVLLAMENTDNIFAMDDINIVTGNEVVPVKVRGEVIKDYIMNLFVPEEPCPMGQSSNSNHCDGMVMGIHSGPETGKSFSRVFHFEMMDLDGEEERIINIGDYKGIIKYSAFAIDGFDFDRA